MITKGTKLARILALAPLSLLCVCTDALSGAPSEPTDLFDTRADGTQDAGSEDGLSLEAHIGEDAKSYLRGCAVTGQSFVRDELYSWTSTSQAQELRRGGRLLVAEMYSGPGPSPFNRALSAARGAKARAGVVASLLLEREDLKRRRYAWSCPFATAVPKGKRSYGRALLRVQLRPQAWIGHFRAGQRDAPLEFSDLSGHPVAEADVLAHPERIGAIYHVRAKARAPFREYILCNESMVASWSLGTDQLRDLVAQEQRVLGQLAQTLGFGGNAQGHWLLSNWAELSAEENIAQLWQATQAFATERHRLTYENVQAMIAALDEHDPGGPALVSPHEAVANLPTQ